MKLLHRDPHQVRKGAKMSQNQIETPGSKLASCDRTVVSRTLYAPSLSPAKGPTVTVFGYRKSTGSGKCGPNTEFLTLPGAAMPSHDAS